MEHWKSLSGTAALLIATSSAAWADVSSADVWQAWKASAEAAGQTFTPGSESQDGGTLTITDLNIAMDTTNTSATGVIDSIVFTENGDGTVSVDFSDSYSITASVRPEDTDEEVDVTMTVEAPTLAMLASGTPDAVTYDYEAETMTITVSEIVVEGEVIELDGVITMSGVTGTYKTTTGDMPVMDMSFLAEAADIDVAMQEPDGGDGAFAATLSYADVEITSLSTLALFAGGATELPAMLEAGASTDGSISHGAATFDVSFEDGSETFALTGGAASGLVAVSLDSEAASYEVNNTGLDISASGSEIPLPQVEFSVGEIGFSVLTPVSASDVPQDFGLGITLADLSLSDMIWSLIDAGGALPHDPATLIVDVTGTGNFLFDLFNPDSMMEVDAPLPGELHTLTINQVRLAAIGGDLNADGAFTFDNDNLDTFDGIPAPTGKINISLAGANAVIDNLIAAGLLPEEQAMGARMMMGLFARPGDGPDTLVSEIEVDGATGAVSANGQRLQ